MKFCRKLRKSDSCNRRFHLLLVKVNDEYIFAVDDIICIRRQKNTVFAHRQSPMVLKRMEAGKIIPPQIEFHDLFFTGSQIDFGEILQLLDRTGEFRIDRPGVDLDDLSAGSRRRVSNFHSNFASRIQSGEAGLFNLH